MLRLGDSQRPGEVTPALRLFGRWGAEHPPQPPIVLMLHRDTPTMAIGTPHVALLHLVKHLLPTPGPTPNQVSDRADLLQLIPVRELQHDRITLAALDAGMLGEVPTPPPASTERFPIKRGVRETRQIGRQTRG
jgi:hypothetical protein